MLELFGLTKHEIVVYNCVSENVGKTGYTIAKEINMSRSNVYTLLNSLVKKGAIIYENSGSIKYFRVNPEEFMNNYIRELNEVKEKLIEELSVDNNLESGYFTIEGEKNVKNKFITLIENLEERAYLCGKKDKLFFLAEYLEKISNQNKKVVVITDDTSGWTGNIQIYKASHELLQNGLIVDSSSAIVGEVSGEGANCLFSNNINFVNSYKINLKNEIEIIELKEQKKKEGDTCIAD